MSFVQQCSYRALAHTSRPRSMRQLTLGGAIAKPRGYASMDDERSRRTIAIVGGGIAGPVFALQVLAHPHLSAHYTPIIFEQSLDAEGRDSADTQTAGAAVGISPNGLFPFYNLGLRKDIEEQSFDLEGLSVWRVFHTENDEVLESVKVHESTGLERTIKSYGRLENVSWSQDVESGMRVMERGKLMAILNRRVIERGGIIRWGRKVKELKCLESGRTQVMFEDKTGAAEHIDADIVVGADGAWSLVRKYILQTRYGDEGMKRWVPRFQGASNIYGISRLKDCQLGSNKIPKDALGDTHGIFLNHAHLSSSPLPEGMIRWDLQLAEAVDPTEEETRVLDIDQSGTKSVGEDEAWTSTIALSPYLKKRTIETLRRYSGVYHPVTGTFGRMLSASTRIFHSPLRNHAWEESEIHCRNVVLLGDAARVLMPSSGQGTSFAIEDAIVLADALVHKPIQHLGDDRDRDHEAFEDYAKRRVKRSKAMASFTVASLGVALGRTWYERLLRSAMLWLMTWSNNPKKKDIRGWPFDARLTVRDGSDET